MTEQEAIHNLNTMRAICCKWENTKETVDMAIKALGKQRWIPVEERLPEECVEVLVTIKEIQDDYYTKTAWIQDGRWVIRKTPLLPEVIAWMELPEAFKG